MKHCNMILTKKMQKSALSSDKIDKYDKCVLQKKEYYHLIKVE